MSGNSVAWRFRFRRRAAANSAAAERVDQTRPLPASVRSLAFGGRNIHLLGTAHVSKESVREVAETLERLRPDVVAVELCLERYQGLMARARGAAEEKFDFRAQAREKGWLFASLHWVMLLFYRRIGKRLGVEPGAEMLEAANWAKKNQARLVFCDQDFNTTMRRLWEGVGMWTKIKLFAHILFGLCGGQRIDAKAIEEMRGDGLEETVAQFSKSFPQLKTRLIDERDQFMARRLDSCPARNLLAVVGVGHVAGIASELAKISAERETSIKVGADTNQCHYPLM